jgi:hypothetical protein
MLEADVKEAWQSLEATLPRSWVVLGPTGLSTDEGRRGPDEAEGAPEELLPQVKTAEEGGGRNSKAGHLSLAIKGRYQFLDREPGDLNYEALEKIMRSNGLCEPIGGVFCPDWAVFNCLAAHVSLRLTIVCMYMSTEKRKTKWQGVGGFDVQF